jgi:hypothetical protein
MSLKKIDRKPHWFNPTEEAVGHLNDVLDDSLINTDVTILDTKLSSTVSESSRKLSEPAEVPGTVDQAQEVPVVDIDIKTARKEQKVLTVQTERKNAVFCSLRKMLQYEMKKVRPLKGLLTLDIILLRSM